MADTGIDQGFIARTVHKRDAFSETLSGHLTGDPDRKFVLRKLSGVAPWLRPIAWFLVRRESYALHTLTGVPGVPQLLRLDAQGLLRNWLDGMPLQLARPDDPAWYRDAKRLLRDMRRRGVTHNDLAKPQNWLRTPDGRAAVIDFQLASVHRRHGKLFRLMAREDLRHLLKQKRNFAPHLLTASERRMLARKSLPTQVWMATGKPLYNFITRRVMHWSDSEGTDDRMAGDGAAAAQALRAHPAVGEVAVFTYPRPAKGTGLYAFIETELPQDRLRELVPAGQVELIQPVKALPRGDDGAVRQDVLHLVATNRIDELEQVLRADPPLARMIAPIVAGRLNITDRL